YAASVEQKIHGDQLSRHPYCSDSGGDDWFPVSAARCEKCHFTNGGDFPRRFCACFLGAFLFSAAGTAGFLLAGVLRKNDVLFFIAAISETERPEQPLHSFLWGFSCSFFAVFWRKK
ncbi:MAG: hypothetical protein IKJ54_02415, partial [Anaerotignum sp.]|nr:hypothetical protein [Anaerotignum sp.]